MKITRILSVFHGNRLFAEGEVHDYSGISGNCELIFKYSGRTMITYGSQTFEESADCIRFLPVTKTAAPYLSRTLEAGEYCYFSFLAEHAPDTILRMQLPQTVGSRIGTLFMKMYHLHTSRTPGSEHFCLALAYEILGELEQISCAKKKFEQLTPAVRYIEEHLTEPIDCDALPALCGISYTHFRNLFRRCYGVSPSRYITGLRMRSACEYLAYSRMPIGVISYMLGYTDLSYFSRLFRRELGCTAQDYRKTHSARPPEEVL